MTDSRLQIRRVHAHYLVPSDHPAPLRVRDRLDDEIKRNLPRILSAAFSSWFSETDVSLWFIRRLDLDLAVNASGNDEPVAKALTMQLGRALGDTLQEGTDQNNVVRFASPADYLAHFLADLVAGDAWGRWYYESFFGLRLLPTSAALRTAACNRHDTGRAALIQLPDADLRRVLRSLNRQDARLILERLTHSVGDDGGFDLHAMSQGASRFIDGDALHGLDEWPRALFLYLAAAREHEERGSHAADAVLRLLRASPDQLREVAGRLNTQTAQAKVDHAATKPRDTSFGGAFLLWPLIDELPLVEALQDWPHADEAAAISLVRFLILIKCRGHDDARRTLTESLLRDLMLVPPGLSAETLSDWQARVTSVNIRHFLRTLVNWQRTQGRVADRRHILTLTSSREAPVLLLLDEARDVWLAAQKHPARQLSDLWHACLSRLEQAGGTLFCEPTLLTKMRVEFPALKVVSLDDMGRDALHEESMSRHPSRLGKLSADLSHLELPGSWEFPPSLDLALSVAAQHVLRAFAWRLPGFSASNLPYLARNFLDFPASVEEEPARRVVRLSGPPLRLVLGITGMMRQTYQLSWLDDRPFTLFEES